MPKKTARGSRSMARKPKPAQGTRKSSHPQHKHALRIKWKGFRPLYDFWGKELKRYYKLETLANATEGLIKGYDRFICPSVHKVLGPAPLVSLSFELFQEGRYQLIFRLRAVNAKKKRGEFAFIVGKNGQELSQIAKSEHRNLQVLHMRAPHDVVEPLGGGTLLLPDRYGRKSHTRYVYAYMTRWLRGYEELGVAKNLQFFINAAPRRTLTRAQTESIKTSIVGIVATTLDRRKRTCIAMPQIASGDFVVTRPRGDKCLVKLIACRQMATNMTPSKLVHAMVRAKWSWGGEQFRLVPSDPKDFFRGLTKALGRDEARGWLAEYSEGIRRGRLRKQTYLSQEILTAFASSVEK